MKNKTLVDELYFCAAQCTHCYDACHLEKNQSEFERCMMLDQDCADICRLAGQVLERNSESGDKFLKLCSEICEACAIECEKHNREHCLQCAKVCRECSEMCLEHQPGN